MDLQVLTPQPGSSTQLVSFLSNTDLLDEIFELLVYEHDDDEEEVTRSRKNLLCAALTCKPFLEPALDRLWKQLDSLFPLLKVLPAFAQSDGTYVLRGHISPEEWARFDWYARRVRKFTYTRDPDVLDIAMHVYFRLAQLRKTPLLPSLQHLYCPSTSQNDFLISGICLFLSPALQILEFDDISGVEDKLCGTVLHTLMTDMAPIQSIILRGKGLSMDTIELAISFDQLRRLVLQGMGETLTMEVLERIGSLSFLETLALDFTKSPIPPLDKSIGLRNLKSLEIRAPVPFIQAFLPQIGTSILESFIVATSFNPSVDRKDLLNYVVSRWGETLRRIDLIHQRLETDSQVFVAGLNMGKLEPLLSLRRLRHFCVEGYTLELRDEDITTIAMSWPEIVSLLLPYVGPSNGTKPTIVSLLTIANRCPQMRKLRISLDMETTAFTSPGVPHLPPHDLHTLIVPEAEDQFLDLKDLMHLARHIDYCFPRLRMVYGYNVHDPFCPTPLQDAVRMYQSVRAEAVALERAKNDDT